MGFDGLQQLFVLLRRALTLRLRVCVPAVLQFYKREVPRAGRVEFYQGYIRYTCLFPKGFHEGFTHLVGVVHVSHIAVGLHALRQFLTGATLGKANVRQEDVAAFRAPADRLENFCAGVVVPAGVCLCQRRAATQNVVASVVFTTQRALAVV